jgi:nickel/cobalt exporter
MIRSLRRLSTHSSRPLALRLLLALLAALSLLAVVLDREAEAHPVGDPFSVNTYLRLTPYADRLRVLYIVDLAEAPSFDEMPRLGVTEDGSIPPDHLRAYLIAKAGEMARGLRVEVDGQRLDLTPVSGRLDLPFGQYATPTVQVRFLYDLAVGEVRPGRRAVLIEDTNAENRSGWREILVGDVPGAVYEGPATFRTDVTKEMTQFSVPLFADAPRSMTAAFTLALDGALPPAPPSTADNFVPLAPSEAPGHATARAGQGADPPGGAAALLLRAGEGWSMVLAAIALAAGFGALHALEPGHGKSLIAAYLVGTRGSLLEAMRLGAIVAVAHTIGALVLGGIVIVGVGVIVPGTLFPALQVLAGLIVLGMGGLLARDLVRGRPLGGDLFAHDHAAPAGGGLIRRRQLWTLGLVNGLVPTGSTIVMLIAAVSLGRVGLGLLLILAFGVGFGAVVASVAAAFVFGTRQLAGAPGSTGRWAEWGARAERALPPIAIGVFLLSGVLLVVRGAFQYYATP